MGQPASNPRYPLGPLIGKRYRGLVDLFISDEVHEAKSLGSAIGAAFGAMVNAAHRTVGLTGTLFGGYSSDVYGLLLRLHNAPVVQEYGWDDEARFIAENGVVDEVTRQSTSTTEGHYSGKTTTSTTPVQRPGVTAKLTSTLQGCSINILLPHMGFHLVDYQEKLQVMAMPGDIGSDYRELEAAGKGIVAFGGHDALGSYLQACLLYPYAPWMPRTIESKLKHVAYTPPASSDDRVLPHHEWLADYAAAQVARGRRVLVYAEHTATNDIMPDVAHKITTLAADRHDATLKVAVLRSTSVKPGERRAWFAAREAEGVNVVLCNPKVVKTGLNLIAWPSIVVLEPVYSLFTLHQAKRRAFRPTQTQDCEVTYVCYAGSMSEKAISIVARKSAAAAILNGDDLSNGLLEFDPGMSLLQELAKAVMSGDEDRTGLADDVRAMLRDGAAALKADLEAGTTGLIGALPAIDTLGVAPADVDAPDTALAITPVAQALLAKLAQQPLVLVMDGSVIGRGCVALMLSVVYHGRALPLAWLVVQGKQGHLPQETHCALLAQLQPLIPPTADVTLLGDGEFDGTALQAMLRRLQWHYVCRTASSITFTAYGCHLTVGDLAPERGELLGVRPAWVTTEEYGPVSLLALWEEAYEEPLYLVTNMPDLQAAIALYRKRAHIETFFSDQKSRGFDIHRSHLSDPKRLTRLLIVSCLAYLWLVYLGVCALRDDWLKRLHRRDRCDLSLFRLGLRLLARCLRDDIALPAGFLVPERLPHRSIRQPLKQAA